MKNRLAPISGSSWIMLPVLGTILALGFFGAAFTANIVLLSSNTTTSTTESYSGMEKVGSDEELALLRGCIADQVLKMQNNLAWGCDTDSTTAVTGAGADVLDLGNDTLIESSDFNELATTGDTNGCVTEPTADKVLFDLSCNWPTADSATTASTATALASDPSDCAANQFTNAIAASGNLTCAAIADADVPNSITIDLASTATALAANPTDCSANQFANAIAASGNLTCAAIADADVPNSITIDLSSTATALASDPSDCAADTKADSIAASGNLTCSAVDTGDISDGTILPADLDDGADTPSDEECLTYETTGTVFEWQTCGAGSGDITDVGPGCASGACLTDGLATSGSAMFIWEGTAVDTNEFTINAPANPTIDQAFTFPDDQIADDDLVLGSGAGTFTYSGLTNCADSSGNHLNYTAATNTFSCGTSSSVTDTDTHANSFETWTPPNGASIVADSDTDTATFTEGAGLDITGTAGTDTLLFEFDAGELGSLTFGTGSGFTWTFNASAGTDPQLTFGDGLFSFLNHLLVDNEAEVRFGENDANGSNYIAVKAPAAVTSNQSCTLENDATPFDSCIDDNVATADALSANPADCGTNTKADAIAANGDLTCSAVDTGDITDGTILPGDLDDGADTPGDEECLTYEGTGTVFEWQTCGGAGANSFETMNTPLGTDPVADGSSDTLIWTSVNATIAVSGDAAADSIDLDAIDLNCTDCIGTTEIADSYLLNNGDVGTGAYDFGGADSVEVPNGTAPTVDAAGEVAVDTTDDQLLVHTGTELRVFPSVIERSLVLENPADADRLLLKNYFQHGVTVTDIKCIVDPADTAESVVIALYESDASGDFTDLATNGLDGTTTITCDNDGAEDDGALSNGTIDAGDWIGIDVGTVTGTVSWLTVTWVEKITRE